MKREESITKQVSEFGWRDFLNANTLLRYSCVINCEGEDEATS
jgi:hypothetical protein